MSRARIIRKSFNGGEIAPELHFRSDIEKYHNSCKQLKNVLVTPWGTAVRRPPTKQKHKFDTAVYGVPVKYLPFRFSLSETFNIVFTDGSGSASPDSNTADLIVLDDQGALQTLEGAGTMILSTPYDPADLINLHQVQINDFIYMTCGGDYPEYYISRFFDSTQVANRWEIKEKELIGGPFEDQNIKEECIFSVGLPNYNPATTYNENDIIFSGVTDSADILSAIWSYRGYATRYIQLNLDSPLTVSPGQIIDVEGLFILSAPGQSGVYWYTQTQNDIDTGMNLDGSYEVISVDGNSVVISRWGYAEFGTPQPLFDAITFGVTGSASASISTEGSGDGYYRSIVGSNTGNLVTDTNFWEPLEVFNGELDLSSSEDVFASSDVNRDVAIEINNLEELNGEWTANQYSNVINAQGTCELETSGGAWGGLLELEVSYNDGSSWSVIGSIRSVNGGYNGSIERTITKPNAILRVRLSQWAAPSGTFDTEKCQWVLRFKTPIRSFFKIIQYTDPRNVVVQTTSPLIRNLSNYRWELGAFSETTGYPQSLTIHEERKIYGGTRSKPNTVWGSTVNDFPNFLKGDLDTSPYQFTIKSDSFDSIRWMRSTRSLNVGTENSESVVGTRDSASVISPTNVDVQTQTYFGSSNVQAIVTADLIYFIQGQNERVRSTQYDFGTDQYLSNEVSLLAHHITESGIKEMSFRRHPYSTIFFVLNNGKAVSFTYERENFVRGWSRVELTNAEFISAASNYSESGDVIVGIVKRGTDYFLEQMETRETDTVYLDSQVQFIDEDYSAGVSVPWTDATGLTVIRNDVELVETTDFTIIAGTLTIPAHADGTVTVGYKYDWCIEPTDFIEFGDFGSTKRASKISLYLLESGGCQIEVNGRNAIFKESLTLPANQKLNGRYELTVDGGFKYTTGIRLSGNDHKPFNLSAIGMYATQS